MDSWSNRFGRLGVMVYVVGGVAVILLVGGTILIVYLLKTSPKGAKFAQA